MKVMNITNEDDEQKAQSMSIPDEKASKQDKNKKIKPVNTPVADKKRKLTSPTDDIRSAKIPKVIAEENPSCDSIKVNLSESVPSNANKMCIVSSHLDSVNTAEGTSSPKSKTPGKTSLSKNKKADCKENALTRFLKPIDNKGNRNAKKSATNTEDKSSEHVEVMEECVKEVVDCEQNKSELHEMDYSDNSEIVSDERKQLSESSTTDESDKKNTSSLNLSTTLTTNSDEVLELSDSSDESGKSDLDDKIDMSLSTTSTPTSKRGMNPESQKRLTPKQLERKLANQRKREEREKIRLEKERKMQEEKDNRRKEKEEKKKEKEEKDKQKKKEKEAREEDRRKREEAKEEEKKRKEEEKQEAERKKQKAASNFVSFFVPKKHSDVKSTDTTVDVERMNFMPFQIKSDMRMAPLVRRSFDEHERLRFDNLRKNGNFDRPDLYISDLKTGKIEPRKYAKTWPIEGKDDDIMILEDEDNQISDVVLSVNGFTQKHRPKLLMFAENRRPPFWGTWRKRSHSVNRRRPFSKDDKWFDYEVDSDEEWEEEDPDGESIHGSDDEKAEENPDDNEYDVDNEFLVPHGYLSEEEEAREDEDERDTVTPESQQFKLKLLGAQFEAEQNTKTTKLKPKVMGLIWMNCNSSHSQTLSSYTSAYLKMRECWVYNIPVDLNVKTETDSMNLSECKTPSSKHGSAGPGTRKTTVPEEAMPDFIRLLHGNTNGKGFLVKEFVTYWNKHKRGEQISKVSLLKKMREISNWMACPDEGPQHLKNCWYVSENYRNQYLPSETLPIPNLWSYLLTPKKQNDTSEKQVEKETKDKSDTENKDKDKKYVALITQYTHKISQAEMKKQLTEKPEVAKVTQPESKPESKPTKSEEMSKSPRISLLSKFLKKDTATKGSKVTSAVSNTDNDSDEDIIVIDDNSMDNKF